MPHAPTGYHAHIYFLDETQRERALLLREAVAQRFPAAILGRVHAGPVAFHPAPMYQVKFAPEHLTAVLPWLHAHHAGLSVLVHPIIGDVVAAHTTEAIWIGAALEVDRERLAAAGEDTSVRGISADSPAPFTILRIDASGRRAGSVGRGLADDAVSRLVAANPGARVVHRDLADGLPLLDPERLSALWTAAGDRSVRQAGLMADGDVLIEELKAADAVVLAMPIYNFGPPAALKAWADLVARSGVTFHYTATGPKGALKDRPVYAIVTSGGLPIGADADHATPWLRRFLGFVGIADVRIIKAERLVAGGEAAAEAARHALDTALPAAQAPA
jgi:FMN-dependent NADH-azoreductase